MPNDVGIRVGVDGEKQFRDSLKGINSQLKNLNTEMQASSREFEKNSNSQQALKSKIDILNRSIDVEKQKIELLTKQYETQNKKLLSLGEELDKVSKEFGENSEQAGKAQNAYNRQAVQVNNLGSQLSVAKSNLNSFENQMKEAVAQSGKLTTGLKNAADKLDKFSTKASSIGNTLTLGVTVPLLGIGTAAVKTGNDFEAQMSRVEAISGATADEIKKLDDLALKLGFDTAFSASEVAQGMENLASAGFTVDEIISAMPGMLDLAASSGADLATASEIAASSIRGFGLEASDAAHVADVFAEAAARTNAQTEDMGEAMNYIAPVANAMGQNLEEVAAAIGIMSDAGVKGSQAGTSLRGALSRLAKPTDKMYETMDKLGISFYDTAGNMLPLNEMIEQLQGSFTGLTQEEQNNALVTLFGQEALSGMMALIERGPDELRSLTKSFEGADGAASDMADTMLDNTAGSIEEMNGALETAAIILQRTLAPHIKNVAGFVTDLAEGFSELDEGTQQFIIGLGFTAAAAGPAVKAISGITSTVGKVSGGLGKLIEKVKGLNTSTKTVSNFGNIIGALSSPVGIATTAIGLLAGGTWLLVDAINSSNAAHDQEIEKIQERIDQSRELTETIKQETDESLSELSVHEDLFKELQGIADENGKIQEGYESRAQFITDQLSQAYGTEITIVDGVIQKYDELSQTFEDLMDKKRADVIVESYAEAWTDSSKKIAEAEENMNTAREEFEQKEQELRDAIIEASSQTDDLGIINQITWNEQRAYEEAREIYNKQEELHAEHLKNIKTYESLYQASLEGNYDEVTRIHKEGLEVERNTISESSNDIANVYGKLATYASDVYGTELSRGLVASTNSGAYAAQEALKRTTPDFEAASKTVANAIGVPFESLNSSKWGSDLVKGLAAGINSEIPTLEGAAVGAALAISSVLHFSRPDEGPLREYEKWPVHFGDRYTQLLEAQKNKFARAAEELSLGFYSGVPTFQVSQSREIIHSIENRISANISPARQAVTVNLPKGNMGGMSLNQTNNFYSPEALSPAETARLNRINVRNAIKAMR